ncbi:S8 family serine peptidase [Neolewinella antarctica]|uniref:Peptidase S8/S53 domain-containing protein n=1 Tax=Neolewinella antarctica TaxID=442734 RepID=A0ABX0X6Y1_9BACT|nr:S8 family serine peptidase [Neolewinella antarctica]NJC24892.1 hypothetical protein [Neolewinella antarctica]
MLGATQTWIAPALNIGLLRFHSPQQLFLAEEKLRNDESVVAFERNTVIKNRTTPNDNFFTEQQLNLERTNFPEAWNLTTGGQTPDGSQIVIAVLDAGFDVNHEDLRESIWRNAGEIPGDGVDNDNNGYVDDLSGWDMIGDDPRVPVNTHGTQVIGTLGARGDNEIGIAGTNWDAKLMLFSFQTVADVIEAYEYVRQQRLRWNESGGREGAFVVATNASFGIEGGTCGQYPVWGSMYEELGKVGVLTAAATANRDWDVDDNGDMPTDCQTDYLIGVANLGKADLLYRNSAYGPQNVDLAAPGEGSYSTLPGSDYGPFGSTSAAAPYVTGAIALLYATPCPIFQALVVSDPAAAALLVREAVLSGAKQLPGLQFRVATGGVLDVAESQRLIADRCDAGAGEALSITSVRPNPASGKTYFTLNTSVIGGGGILTIFDGTGRRIAISPVRRVGVAPVVVELDVSQFPAGYYQVLLEERGRSAVTALIVK